MSLWKIFAAFVKIGAFTIGGGYIMVPAIEAEMRRRRWISGDELPDIVAIAQSAPGLLTANMAIFAGYKLRGVAGSIVATLGCLLAPFVVILAIAMFFNSFSDNPYVIKIFSGVRPAAVALITGYFIRLTRRSHKLWQLAITACVLVLMVLLKVSAIYMILVTITGAVAVALLRQKRNGRNQRC
ncbi:MAG: chromate transporter [Bacteroidales bacterium]|nr:chromate transporter [Bacteroidales bacterium]